MSKKRKPVEDAPDQVIWCDRGWQNVYFGFCPSRAAWKRQMRRFNSREPFPPHDACATTFTKDGKTSVIVTLADDVEANHSREQVLGLLVHECTHVWQAVRDGMQERFPSIEFEAYSMQAIFQGIYAGWEKTRGERGLKDGKAG